MSRILFTRKEKSWESRPTEKIQWTRVTKKLKCPICDHDSYCVIGSNGIILCMRVASKTQSKGKAGGWLHLPDSKTPRPYIPKLQIPSYTPKIDFDGMWMAASKQTSKERVKALAKSLSVEPMALHLLGAAWMAEHGAWAFPMRDGAGKVVGIRLRNENGEKWAIRGSKSGLFIPNIDFNGLAYVVEGPTSAAAALTMELPAIGRPSCQGNTQEVNDFIQLRKIRRVILIADNDSHDAGLRGAEVLQKTLKVPSCLIMLPVKDSRDLLAKVGIGGREIILNLTKQTVWVNSK